MGTGDGTEWGPVMEQNRERCWNRMETHVGTEWRLTTIANLQINSYRKFSDPKRRLSIHLQVLLVT